MLGKNILHKPLVKELTTVKGVKGQRNTGIEARRDAMAHRYYFHATINRLLYKDCLFALNQEFHLQPDTIVSELLKRTELIYSLSSQEITTAELRKKYPFYNWMAKLL